MSEDKGNNIQINNEEEEFKNPLIDNLKAQLAESEKKLQDQYKDPNADVPIDNPLAEPNDDKPEAPKDRPEWLPEQFKSPEELAKAYAELEAKTKAQAEQKNIDPQSYGDYAKYVEEFHSTGELSEASYKELVETKGIPKALVDEYIQLGKRQAELSRTEAEDRILEDVGGRAKFQEMAEWAKKSLSEDEIEGLNASLSSDNEKAIKFALKTLKDKFTSANAQKPKLIQGQTSPVQNEGAFKSQEELNAAMQARDNQGRLLYHVSPAYRDKVIQRLARSKL